MLAELTKIFVNAVAAGLFFLGLVGLLLVTCTQCDANAADWPIPRGKVLVVPVTADIVDLPIPEPQTAYTAGWYVIDDNDVPVKVACPACPGGTREGTWAEIKNQRGFWLQRRPDLVWCFAQTDEGDQIIQWVLYENPGLKIIPNPRYKRAVQQAVQQMAQPTYQYQPSYQYSPSMMRSGGGGCPSGRCPGGGG